MNEMQRQPGHLGVTTGPSIAYGERKKAEIQADRGTGRQTGRKTEAEVRDKVKRQTHGQTNRNRRGEFRDSD